MADNQILFCQMLEIYFHVFQRNVKVDCIFNNLTLICFKSGGFKFSPIYKRFDKLFNLVLSVCAVVFPLARFLVRRTLCVICSAALEMGRIRGKVNA